MLGRSISDPERVEVAETANILGMGLLEMDTVFRGEKVQTQTEGVLEGINGLLSVLNGKQYKGYEIHMGRSEQKTPVLNGTSNVYGSYLHGIFDAPGISDAILKMLCDRKGVDFAELGSFDIREYKERQYDLLADAVRNGLDMDQVYRILNREM